LAVEDRHVTRLDGGWEEWLAWRAAQREAARGESASAGTGPERGRDARRARAEAIQEKNRRLRPLREEVLRLESRIAAIESRIGTIDGDLGDPAIHADGVRMRELAHEREALENELAALEPAWEKAATRLDEVEAELG
jgi:ATP-binding cassette subfamily F protein 3